uniref:Uncharacterized protein n=1 Tax=Arundo donax TaxID=35708 RepID=A0A0A9AJZ3_ARUDO
MSMRLLHTTGIIMFWNISLILLVRLSGLQ